MCLAMNADRLEPGERCASTSNRNFEGRQGRGGRTHLMSPAIAAAAAITGRLNDVRKVYVMALFTGFADFFNRLTGKKKKPAKWVEEGQRDVAKPTNPTPLDPGNPWIT